MKDYDWALLLQGPERDRIDTLVQGSLNRHLARLDVRWLYSETVGEMPFDFKALMHMWNDPMNAGIVYALPDPEPFLQCAAYSSKRTLLYLGTLYWNRDAGRSYRERLVRFCTRPGHRLINVEDFWAGDNAGHIEKAAANWLDAAVEA